MFTMLTTALILIWINYLPIALHYMITIQTLTPDHMLLIVMLTNQITYLLLTPLVTLVHSR